MGFLNHQQHGSSCLFSSCSHRSLLRSEVMVRMQRLLDVAPDAAHAAWHGKSRKSPELVTMESKGQGLPTKMQSS